MLDNTIITFCWTEKHISLCGLDLRDYLLLSVQKRHHKKNKLAETKHIVAFFMHTQDLRPLKSLLINNNDKRNYTQGLSFKEQGE